MGGMDKALETIKPAFPALKNSLLTLTDALLAFASIRSKYRKAVPNGDGPIPKGIYKRIVHLMPVLDEALEQLTPAFPILAETLIMLSRAFQVISSYASPLPIHFSSQCWCPFSNGLFLACLRQSL